MCGVKLTARGSCVRKLFKVSQMYSAYSYIQYIYIYISVMTTLGGIGMVMYMTMLMNLVLAE